MPTITANTSTQISLPAGSYLNGTGAGVALAAGSVDPLTNGDAWQIGPFSTTQTINITAHTAISYDVKTLAASPPAVLSTSEVAATQALVSGGGKNSVMVIGDSWGARHYTTSALAVAYADIGALSWAQALSGQKLSIYAPGAAIGGSTSGDWANTYIQPALVGYSPGWIVCFLGINDIASDVALATTQANLTTVYDRCLATGAKLIIANIGPFGSTYVVSGASLAVKTAQRSLLNKWIAEYVATHSNCWLIDQYAALVNSSDTSGYTQTAFNDTFGTTGLHTTAAGARAVGAIIAGIWAAYGVTDTGLHAAGYVDGYDYDTAAKNRLSNQMMLGTGGTTSPGAGTTITNTQIATSWTVGTVAGTSTTVCTTEARTVAADGDTLGQNQVLTITGAGAADVVSLRTGSISTRFAEGDIVEGEMFVRVSGASGLKGIRLLMQSVQGGVTYVNTGMSYPTSGVSYSQADAVFAIKTPPMTIGAGALSGHILSLDVAFAGSGAAVVRAGRASWRKLN